MITEKVAETMTASLMVEAANGPTTGEGAAVLASRNIPVVPDVLANAGMVFSGTSPEGRLVEIAELQDHPFMVGSQFHPELKSRPNRPHPLFRDFLAAAAALAGEQPALLDLDSEVLSAEAAAD